MFYWEITGTFFALIGVYLTGRQNVWCWPMGILGVLIYGYIFFVSKLYADAGLQIVYFFMSVYGWLYWNQSLQKKADFEIKKMSVKQHLFTFLAAGVAGLFIVFFLKNYTDSDLAFWDAYTAIFSLAATYWMAKKYLEHWMYWVVIDFIYTGIYLYKNMYVTTFQYFIFFILALYGYIRWRKAVLHYSSKNYLC